MDESVGVKPPAAVLDSGEFLCEVCPDPEPSLAPSPRLAPIPEAEVEEWSAEAVEASEEAGRSES